MIELASDLARSPALYVKFWKRAKHAQETFSETVQKALATNVSDVTSPASLPWQPLTSFAQ